MGMHFLFVENQSGTIFFPWIIPNNFGCQCLAQLHVGWAETFRSKRTLREGGGAPSMSVPPTSKGRLGQKLVTSDRGGGGGDNRAQTQRRISAPGRQTSLSANREGKFEMIPVWAAHFFGGGV